MLEGGECYPFSKKNFAEAVRNMPDVEIGILLEAVRGALKNQALAYISSGVALEECVKSYWKKCALVDAEEKHKD